MADAIALTFSAPLFITAMAIPLLGERVGWRRIMAVLLGFIGVLVMVQPTGDVWNWAVLFPLGASLAGALRDVVTRRISASESSTATLCFTSCGVSLAGLCTLPLGWQPISGPDWGYLALSGCLVGAAHFLLIETFRLAEASLVAPFKYSSLLWAVLFGFLIWGDLPGLWVLAGSILVIGGGLYLLRHAIAL